VSRRRRRARDHRRHTEGKTDSPREPAPTKPSPTSEEPAPGRKWESVIEAGLYSAFALFLTWPLGLHVFDRIPMGTEPVGTVPLFNLWTLWWNADRLQSLYLGYWDAPIFHPLPGAFAFSEPQPLTGLVAALLSGLLGSSLFGYNAVLLLGLSLNGWSACRLLRAVGMVWPVALAGGAIVETLPFVQQELGVLQLVSLGGAIATLHALVRLTESPSPRRGVWLGLAFAATALMCGYYALMLGVLVPLSGGWLLLGGRQTRARWRALGVAILTALPLLLLLVIPQLGAARDHGLQRSAATVKKFSANGAHYRTVPWPQLVPTPGIETASRPGARAFWPGTLKIGLALAGLVWGLRFGLRRWTAFCATLLALAFMLSFGPADDGGPSLYSLLTSLYPGVAQLRSPFRFAVFVQLAVALLAAGGLGVVWARTRLAVPWRVVLVLGLGTLVALELRPREQALLPLPREEATLPWLAWVESETRPEDVLAFLPFPRGRNARDYLETTQWMFWQTRHGRPMVNGYSGFFPKPFRELKAGLEHFPDAASLELLANRGVRYCVVLRATYPPSELEGWSAPDHGLRRVFSDDVAGLDVYELVVAAGGSARQGSRDSRGAAPHDRG
jgi:hypothetical protein